MNKNLIKILIEISKDIEDKEKLYNMLKYTNDEQLKETTKQTIKQDVYYLERQLKQAKELISRFECAVDYGMLSDIKDILEIK